MVAGEDDWDADAVRALLANPMYAINIHPNLAVAHPPIIDVDQWVGVNVKMINEVGADAWLRQLLDVLQGNHV